ncbi:MAG: hypothetical protein KDD92_06050 [Caldilineaceae bacterium]|nr:hypothetical protein [Caldilineaceae bacterium]
MRVLSMAESSMNRIALDIHDGPVQYLFTALSLLAGIQNDADTLAPGTDLTPRLARVATLLESSLYEIKFFLGAFRPPEFRQHTMVSLVEGLVIQHEDWTGATVKLTIDQVPADLPLPIKISFYRIVQEALSNAYHHAGVDYVNVHIWSTDTQLGLEVVDDGMGFIPPDFDASRDVTHNEYIGLYGMRDRIQLLGGVFQLDSKPGAGTRIRAEVPLYG